MRASSSCEQHRKENHRERGDNVGILVCLALGCIHSSILLPKKREERTHPIIEQHRRERAQNRRDAMRRMAAKQSRKTRQNEKRKQKRTYLSSLAEKEKVIQSSKHTESRQADKKRGKESRQQQGPNLKSILQFRSSRFVVLHLSETTP